MDLWQDSLSFDPRWESAWITSARRLRVARRKEITTVGEVVVGAVIRIVICRLVTLVVTGEHIRCSLAAIPTQWVAIKRVGLAPQVDGSIYGTVIKFISRKATGTGV